MRQVALGLGDSRLRREGIHIVRRDIENLLKFPHRFGKTTKRHIGNRVLGEYLNVARVESLGFVEVRLAAVPLALPPWDVGQRLRNLAAVWQELTRLLKVAHRAVVILQTGVVVISLS